MAASQLRRVPEHPPADTPLEAATVELETVPGNLGPLAAETLAAAEPMVLSTELQDGHESKTCSSTSEQHPTSGIASLVEARLYRDVRFQVPTATWNHTSSL